MKTTTTSVEVVAGTTGSGDPCLRVFAPTLFGPLAGAMLIDERWHLLAYRSGPPGADLIAGSEADARAWLAWIGEQLARACA